VRAHPEQEALVVAAEICSLAFHPSNEAGNLTSALIFGDGAGAAVVGGSATGDGAGLEIVDSFSALVPGSQDALGFALTGNGFLPLLTREIADLLPAPSQDAVEQLLGRHGLRPADLGFWLVHPGGPRILSAIERRFGLGDGALCWSWQSLREAGNTSSASIFDVIRRYLADADAGRGWGVVLAFGPGISLELLLVRRC
jgi:alkylresorcinol/alkylpyrone synthase